jgi:xylulokinase
MKNLLLGIDVGTYSSKAVVTTLSGKILRTVVVPHGISIPQPGYVEQDADAVWWKDLCELCKQIFAEAPFAAANVASVAVSAIGPCLLPLDSSMKPLRAAILYGVDVRAELEIAEMEAELGTNVVREFSLMGFTSQAVGPKIRWLRKHEPELWRATAMLTSASSYLVYRLTGQHRMDRHTASHYMPLYNPKTGQWDARYSSGLAPLSLLPKLGWPDELAGEIHREAAAATGLVEGTPVAVGTVDALSEAISVGVVRPGDLMIMYGSTTFFVLVQERPTPDPRVWTVAGAHAGQFNLAAGMSTTGSLTRWFKDEFARDLKDETGYAELFQGAARVPPGSGGLLLLPYFSGERTPINDPKASGVIAGLSLSHTREHLFRALLEGVGYGVRHNLETFAAIGAQVNRLVAVGGGVQTDTWLQIVSDIAGVTQIVPSVTVGASYGDAFLAGCAVGLLRRNDIDAWAQPGRVIEPTSGNKVIYDQMYEQYLRLYDGTQAVMHRLKSIPHWKP